MSDDLRKFLDLAKGIQSDLDALGVGKPAQPRTEAVPGTARQELPPLTSEDWIAGLAYKASSNPTVQRVVRDHLLYLRNVYEAALAQWAPALREQDAATIRGLEKEANALSETLREALEHIEQLAADNATLKQELAERYAAAIVIDKEVFGRTFLSFFVRYKELTGRDYGDDRQLKSEAGEDE